MFTGVRYHLPSTLPAERHDELADLLTQHHAARADSVFNATHIITNSDAFEGWRDVNSDEVSIVSDIWVDRSIAAGKMQPPCFYSASPSKIFSGVVACSADLRVSDEEVLHAGITSLGGQWRVGLTKDVTHLFAVSTNSEKYSTGMNNRHLLLKVLLPDWFDDSVAFGLANLSTETYEWPDPAVLKRRPGSPVQLKQSKKQQRSSMSPQKKALYETATWDPSQPKLVSKEVWNGRRILLSTSLELTGARRKIVEEGVRQAKGMPVKYSSSGGDGTSDEELRLLSDCDVFVTRYRTGPAFFKAWRAGKIIGTLSWLLNVQVTGIHSSPLDQILHFPIPPGTVEGFEKHEISITNYTGESRDYLKKLITLMGGNFTPTLSPRNTVLIAAQMSGSKTTKAVEWSIPVVNHTWLEDCFLRWQSLTPAVPKYVLHPAGIDFVNILGQRGVGPDIEEIIAAEAAEVGEDVDRPQGSQNSEDETEVEGGLMPAVDIDSENNPPEDTDFDMEAPPSFEGESSRRSFADPSTPKSASSSPVKPQSARKKRIRGLSTSSESQFDPEITKKVVRVTRPASTPKATPKKKSKETDSESEVSQDEDDSVPRPVRKQLIRRVSGPAPHRSPPTPRRSPRKAAAESQSPSQQRSTNKLPVLHDSDSDSDDLPVQLAPPRAPKAPVVGGIVKATRVPPSAPVSRRSDGKEKASPHKATPTPPSSPLSAPPSPPKHARGMPTAIVSVVVPDRKTAFSLAASPLPKKPSPARTHSLSVVNHHRATPTSAPTRTRQTKTVAAGASSPTRASSPASSIVAPENGGRARRSAATRATQRLHDEIMPDVVNFQNEMRNRGRKTRRVSGRTEPDDDENGDDEEEERPITKRRKLDAGKGRASTSEYESTVEQPAKTKGRKSDVASRNGKPIKLLTTQLELPDDILKALAQLGAKVTGRATECTHLIVPKLVRTEKLLCALAGGAFILTKAWALDSVAADSLMPEEDYLLQDDAGEAKYAFSLAKAVDRAKILKGKLFKDLTFYVTPKVKIDSALLRSVVVANGGQIITNQQPSIRILETHPDRHVISCKEDEALCMPIAAFRQIYTQELILTSALRQQIDWDEEAFQLKIPV